MVVVVGGGWWLKVSLVFIFGPKPKFCSFDLDLDQAEQYSTTGTTHHQQRAKLDILKGFKVD